TSSAMNSALSSRSAMCIPRALASPVLRLGDNSRGSGPVRLVAEAAIRLLHEPQTRFMRPPRVLTCDGINAVGPSPPTSGYAFVEIVIGTCRPRGTFVPRSWNGTRSARMPSMTGLPETNPGDVAIVPTDKQIADAYRPYMRAVVGEGTPAAEPEL